MTVLLAVLAGWLVVGLAVAVLVGKAFALGSDADRRCPCSACRR